MIDLERDELCLTARGLLDQAVGDLRSLQESWHAGPMLGERFASLAEGFEKLGDNDRATAVAAWARPAAGRPPRKPSVGPGEPKDVPGQRSEWPEGGEQ